MAKSKEIIASFVAKLIEDGTKLLETQSKRSVSSISSVTLVDLEQYHQWCASCRLLVKQLGPFSEPWEELLFEQASSYINSVGSVTSKLGGLKSILENVEHGRLSSFEDIVFAEAFANLIDQGEYLLEKDYHIAAGVIFRAVLEERLRRLCDVHSVMPEKKRPTIADFNQALYKANAYDKIVMKQVDAMAAVGNAAAHGSDEFDPSSVSQLHTNLVDFLVRFAIE